MLSTPLAHRLLLSLALVLTACSANVPRKYDGTEGRDSGLHGRAGRFDAERAWEHLEALAEIGPRPMGTVGAERAREYVTEQLEGFGLGVSRHRSEIQFDQEGVEPLELVNLEAVIRGASADEIVLAAPFDSAYRESFDYLGVNDGASGTAVLLETARVIAADPLPYTVRLLFLDGEAPLGRGAPEDRDMRYIGSAAAAGRLSSEGRFKSLRVLIMLNRVSDADLKIARDRFSQRTYRDLLWTAAAEAGHADVFAPGDSFEAPRAGHRAFIQLGMRRVVAVVDPVLGAADLAEAGEFSEDDTLERSSPQSLAAVGAVLLAGLESISARLVRIDNFSEVPEPEDPPIPVADSPAPAGAEAAEGEAPETNATDGEGAAADAAAAEAADASAPTDTAEDADADAPEATGTEAADGTASESAP